MSVWLLPDIIRREAMTRIPALTGRAVRIEDVDLNLFTGRFAVKGIWVAERDGRTPFVELSRVEGRVWLPSLLAMDVRLLDLRLVGLSARVARTGEQEFNFSDLMDLILKADPAAKPTRWTFTLDQVALEQGRVHAEDRFVSPAASWSIDRLEANATGITKRSGAPPGRLTVRLKLGELEVDAAADDVRLAPVILAAKVTVKGLDLARLVPYVPPGTPVVAESGALAVSLSLGWKREPGRVDVAVVRGDVNLSALALTQPGRTAPFATIPRMSVRIKEADAISRRVVIERVLIEGLEVRAVRDDAGQVDLLGPFAVKREAPGPPDPAAVPVPAARPAPERPWHVRVEQVAVTSATAVFTDGMASPAVDWRVAGVSFEAAGLDTDTQATPGTMRLDAELTASSAPADACGRQRDRDGPPRPADERVVQGHDQGLRRGEHGALRARGDADQRDRRHLRRRGGHRPPPARAGGGAPAWCASRARPGRRRATLHAVLRIPDAGRPHAVATARVGAPRRADQRRRPVHLARRSAGQA